MDLDRKTARTAAELDSPEVTPATNPSLRDFLEIPYDELEELARACPRVGDRLELRPDRAEIALRNAPRRARCGRRVGRGGRASIRRALNGRPAIAIPASSTRSTRRWPARRLRRPCNRPSAKVTTAVSTVGR